MSTVMNRKRRILVCLYNNYFGLFVFGTILLSWALSSCQTKNPDKAGVKQFYYIFSDSIDNDWSHALISDLSKEFERGDYYISEASAASGWPFYATAEPGVVVLKSDMIPPHTLVNRLAPISDFDAGTQGDHIHKLWILLEQDSLRQLAVTKQSYTWSNDQWVVFSKRLGSEYAMPDDPSLLVDTLSKTMIRYTFK